MDFKSDQAVENKILKFLHNEFGLDTKHVISLSLELSISEHPTIIVEKLLLEKDRHYSDVVETECEEFMLMSRDEYERITK